MSKMPEKIYVYKLSEDTGGWADHNKNIPSSPAYVRSDIHEALRQSHAELLRELQYIRRFAKQDDVDTISIDAAINRAKECQQP